ncbi:MAG: DUF4249 domain-containing protein [Prevotellaceae bacterium]|jgi:hypothetical protein|nr:DUF4249 domain-containing protein [Prevotellaceae bacterium]
MRNSTKIFILCIFATLFSACETIIEFKGSETQPLLVVTSYIAPDSVIFVRVTQSKFFLEPDTAYDYIRYMKNANVQLFVNDEFVEQLEYFEYYEPANFVLPQSTDTISPSYVYYSYVSKSKVKSGDRVKIKVSAPNFKDAWGETVVPFPAPIISVDTITQFQSLLRIKFYIKFKDIPSEDNYYILIIGKFRKDLFLDNANHLWESVFFHSYQLLTFVSEDILFDYNTGYDYWGHNPFFTDELIKDKEYTVKCDMLDFGIDRYYYYPNEEDDTTKYYVYNPNDEISGDYKVVHQKAIYAVKLQTISKEYYQFLKTANEVKMNEDDVTNLFTEPQQIFNNINGGIGIVGSYAESVVYIDFR